MPDKNFAEPISFTNCWAYRYSEHANVRLDTTRHEGSANTLFFDGHVKALKKNDPPKTSTADAAKEYNFWTAGYTSPFL